MKWFSCFSLRRRPIAIIARRRRACFCLFDGARLQVMADSGGVFMGDEMETRRMRISEVPNGISSRRFKILIVKRPADQRKESMNEIGRGD